MADDQEDRLQGTWVRADQPPPVSATEGVRLGHDPGMLPATIEFFGSRYRATKAASQGFIAWDVGTFTASGNELTLSIANDSLETYPIVLKDNEFVVTLDTGTNVRYFSKR